MTALALFDESAELIANFRRDEQSVERHHLGTPRKHVIDGSARPVVSSAQLQISQVVAGFVPSPLVVDRFLGKQRPPKVLLHDVAVLQHLSFFPSVRDVGGNGKPNVAAFDVSPDFSCLKSVSGPGFLPFRFARGTAKALLNIRSPAWLATLLVDFTALVTCERVTFVGISADSGSGAVNRAIQRVPAVLFDVGVKVRLRHHKIFSALFAGKVYGRAVERGEFFAEPVSASALQTAIPSACRDSAWGAVKVGSARLARKLSLCGHLVTSLVYASQSIAQKFVVVNVNLFAKAG